MYEDDDVVNEVSISEEEIEEDFENPAWREKLEEDEDSLDPKGAGFAAGWDKGLDN